MRHEGRVPAGATMRLTIRDESRHFDQQTHAYAEYRAFSTLAGHDRRFDEVTVDLTGAEDGRPERRVVCRIAVTMRSGEAAEFRAAARHPYAAIDRALALVRGISVMPAAAKTAS